MCILLLLLRYVLLVLTLVYSMHDLLDMKLSLYLLPSLMTSALYHEVHVDGHDDEDIEANDHDLTKSSYCHGVEDELTEVGDVHFFIPLL